LNSLFCYQGKKKTKRNSSASLRRQAVWFTNCEKIGSPPFLLLIIFCFLRKKSHTVFSEENKLNF
jgi:hypothetical protein